MTNKDFIPLSQLGSFTGLEEAFEDDVTFDAFDEDAEDNECLTCNATGEVMYDSQSCLVCLGKGFL